MTANRSRGVGRRSLTTMRLLQPTELTVQRHHLSVVPCRSADRSCSSKVSNRSSRARRSCSSSRSSDVCTASSFDTTASATAVTSNSFGFSMPRRETAQTIAVGRFRRWRWLLRSVVSDQHRFGKARVAPACRSLERGSRSLARRHLTGTIAPFISVRRAACIG